MKRLVTYLMAVMVLATMVTGCVTEGRRMAMRQGLDSINMVNRSGKPFTVQDVEPYVEFFDDHGEANDRLLAHYLLGLAYYDHGEAPMALQCYQDALDCADTTRADCDYAQLSRVYAQMAEVFCKQQLFREQLKYDNKAVWSALKGNDTLSALRCYEQKYIVYKNLGLTDSAVFVIEDVASLYDKYGYSSDAAISLGTIVLTLIEKGNFEKAYEYLNRYEKESGFFDKEGNIFKGYEYYYKVKGLYYLRNGKSDSAEYFFRKELRNGWDFNNQNAAAIGLAELYKYLNVTDSIAKYTEYAYAMNDSMYAQMSTETVGRMQAMYDYSRHQNVAKQEKEKATERLVLIWITISVILLLTALLVVILFYLQHVRQKRKAIEWQYLQSRLTIEQARKDISQLQSYKEQNKNLILEKERLIAEQEIIRKAILKDQRTGQEIALKQFNDSDIFHTFCKYSDSGKQPARNDWSMLQDALFNAYPNFSDLMTAHCQTISDREYKVCLLIRAGFKPNTISNMLGTQPSVITQLRTDLYMKLFKKSGKSKEFDLLLRKIY